MTIQGTSALYKEHAFGHEADTGAPSKKITMCDGSVISSPSYNTLVETSRNKFRVSHHGCAQAVRSAVPLAQWSVIAAWIATHRPKFANNTQTDDILMAALIGYAARRRHQNVACLFDEIVQTKSAHMLLPPTN